MITYNITLDDLENTQTILNALHDQANAFALSDSIITLGDEQANATITVSFLESEARSANQAIEAALALCLFNNQIH